MYYAGDNALSFAFEAFIVMDVSLTVTYEALLSNGSALPDFITFYSH